MHRIRPVIDYSLKRFRKFLFFQQLEKLINQKSAPRKNLFQSIRIALEFYLAIKRTYSRLLSPLSNAIYSTWKITFQGQLTTTCIGWKEVIFWQKAKQNSKVKIHCLLGQIMTEVLFSWIVTWLVPFRINLLLQTAVNIKILTIKINSKLLGQLFQAELIYINRYWNRKWQETSSSRNSFILILMMESSLKKYRNQKIRLDQALTTLTTSRM